MTQPSKSARKSVAGRLVFSLLVLALAFGIFLYRQRIVDQLSFQSYVPSQEIRAITDRAELTNTGKFYFYTSHPAVQDRTNFNQSCTTMRGETSVVLGCYVVGRIFLFNVTDAKLDGIKEVTAAHEMLHAAYERLSASERTRVDGMLEDEASKITDPEFVALMEEYAKSEPGERLNELHSIIGTQVASVGPELESYYGQYFKNRAGLVTLYSTYQTVFKSVQDQQKQLVSEMDDLMNQINTASENYNDGVRELDDDITKFNQRARSGDFSSQAQFNSERTALIARQKRLGDDRTLIDGYIATYNTKRQQLATINSQAEALNRSINSNLTPLPSI